MTSVVHSARQSSASVFDTLGSLANSANQLVGVGSVAIDALDAKASLMRERVVTNARAQRILVRDQEITTAASDHADMLADIHKRNYPGQPFDRTKAFEEALKKIREAVEQAA